MYSLQSKRTIRSHKVTKAQTDSDEEPLAQNGTSTLTSSASVFYLL
jgi:hypothetical protein